VFSLGEKLHCLLKRSQVWKAAFFEADSLGLEGQSPLHEHKQVANTHNLVRVFIQLEKKKMERSRNRRRPAKKRVGKLLPSARDSLLQKPAGLVLRS